MSLLITDHTKNKNKLEVEKTHSQEGNFGFLHVHFVDHFF